MIKVTDNETRLKILEINRLALARLYARLGYGDAGQISTITEVQQVSGDRLLTVAEAAARLGVSKDYLYRHAKKLPFARRMGRKLLFSSEGINQYIKRGRY